MTFNFGGITPRDKNVRVDETQTGSLSDVFCRINGVTKSALRHALRCHLSEIYRASFHMTKRIKYFHRHTLVTNENYLTVRPLSQLCKQD